MGTISLISALGAANSQAFQFDGTNALDFFPVAIFDSANPTNPSLGAITIQGVQYRTELWDVGDEKTIKWELNHNYKDGTDLELHIRVFPTTDNAGTVNFEYEYFIEHVDGTTDAGTTVNLTATIAANDKTNNIGQYLNAVISGTSLVNGDMIIGVMSRTTGTYADDVAPLEFGLHGAIGQLGINF